MTDSTPTAPVDTGDPTGASQTEPDDSTTQVPAGGEAESTTDYRKLYEDTLSQSRKWEQRAKSNASKAKKLDEIEAANRSESEQAAERAEQAEARAKSAVTAAVNAEIRAAAHGWANPGDAPRYLDDKDRYIGDDGEVDTDAIAVDVATVLKDRPYLAVSTTDSRGKRGPSPDPGQGARGGTSLAEQIRAAEAKGDHRAALRLKTQQLLAARR
jgi:hypothetical protein